MTFPTPRAWASLFITGAAAFAARAVHDADTDLPFAIFCVFGSYFTAYSATLILLPKSK